MGKRPEPAQTGIVTSDGVRAGVMRRRRILIGLVSLLVLAGIGAGGWYAWNNTSLLHNSTPITAVDYSKLSPAAAVKAAQSQVDTAQTPAEKQAAYTALGDAYTSKGQASQSTAAYQQALTYSSGTSTSVDDIQILERLSGEYEAAGDKANAISTLQKLIATLNASQIEDKAFLLSRYQGELEFWQGQGA